MEEKLIPLVQCQLVNLRDRNTVDITALHETGHLIVMYALNMMDSFLSITIESGNHTNEVTGQIDQVKGLTNVTPEYIESMNQYRNRIQQASITHNGSELTSLIRIIKVEGAIQYLPNICRLFGGGSICRYYGMPDEDMCLIDYNLIDTLLFGLGIKGKREETRLLVDMYLNDVFQSFESLIKAIYKNLIVNKTLNKEQVMHIIREWETFKW